MAQLDKVFAWRKEDLNLIPSTQATAGHGINIPISLPREPGGSLGLSS